MGKRILYSSERALIEGIVNQENEAYEYLYNNYFKMIERFVLKNSGRYEEAKDVFQDGIISITEKAIAKKLILTSSFKTFFYSICRYIWLNKLRSRKAYIEINDLEDYLIEVQEDTFDYEQGIKKLNRMKELGEKCQQILKLYYYDRKTMEQIALALNYTNADNVKNQKSRCFKQLKEKIAYDRSTRY